MESVDENVLSPFRDAVAMAHASMRDDQAAWQSLWFPYFAAFVEGNRQPMVDLLAAFSRFAAEAVGDYARFRDAAPETVMQGWVLWAAKHDFDNPPKAPPS